MSRQHAGSARRSRGVSLIELMVALLIGAVLVLGLVQVFSASRTAYQLSEGMSRVQENARFAMDYLQRDIRMAGHFGCVNDQSHLQTAGAMNARFATLPANPTDPLGTPFEFRVSIAGINAPGTSPTNNVQVKGEPALGALPGALGTLAPVPVNGSDLLVLRYLMPTGASVENLTLAGSNVVIRLASGRWPLLTAGGRPNPNLYGIADCRHVDVFRGTSPGGTGVVDVTALLPSAAAAADVSTRYTPQPSGQTQLYRAESIVYYVGQPAGAGRGRTLYRAFHNGTTYVSEEMVEGVESLQLIYGLDREANLAVRPPTGYVDNVQVASAAWTALDWRRVGFVQVGLLMGSTQRVGSETGNRSVLGVNFTPPATADGLYRSSYENTIALRNRLYGN